MVEIIFDALAYIFVEIIFSGVKMIGLLTIKVFTLNKDSIEALKTKYKGSFVPYLIGLGVIVATVYFLIN